MVFFTHFSDSFHGNLNRQFSKTYELFDDRSVKTVWRLCLNFERTFQTSSSEKFCAASFKLPPKTRTWEVKEKNENFTLNCIRIARNTAATNKVSHNNFLLDPTFPHENEGSFLGASEWSCSYVRLRLKGLAREGPIVHTRRCALRFTSESYLDI